MRALLLLTVAALGAGAALADWQQQQPMRPRNPLLARVFANGASLTYQGQREVFVRRRGDKIQKYQEVISKKGANLKIKFFGADDINGQILVENAATRWHFIPKRNEIRESPARQEESLMFLIGPMMVGGGTAGSGGGSGRSGDERGGRGGQRGSGGGSGGQGPAPTYTETDGGYVAGFRTRLLTLSDATKKRVFIELWIESNHGVILKRIAYGPKKEQIGGFEFKTINFKPAFGTNEFRPLSIAGAKLITVEDLLMAEAKKYALKPYRIQGQTEYKLLSARGFEQDKSKGLVLVYTNGRNRLSLFQVKGRFDAKRFQSEAGGFESVIWSKDGVNFAIVGSMEKSKLEGLSKRVKA